MIFLFVFIAIFLYFSWKRPLWTLGFILFTLPIYQFRFHLFIPFTLLEAEILILFFVSLIRFAYTKQKIVFPNRLHSYIIIAFLLIASFAVFYSPVLKKAAGFWKAYFIEPVLLSLIALNLVRSKKNVLFLVKSLAFGAFWIGLWAIGQKFFGGGVMSMEDWGKPEVWRATGPFPHPNFLGLYLGPLLPLCLGLFFQERKVSEKALWISAFFIGAVALILARSEGAILAVGLATFLFLFFAGKKERNIAIFLLIIALMLFSLNLFSLRDKFITKITFQDLSGQLRLNIWDGAFKMLKDSPIFGVGLGGYQKLAPFYQEKYYSKTGELISVETHPYPHNLFLSIYLELGVFGFLVFCLIIGLFFAQGISLLKEKEYFIVLGVNLSILVILVHGLVDTPYFKNDLSVLFWILFSFPLSFHKSQNFGVQRT